MNRLGKNLLVYGIGDAIRPLVSLALLPLLTTYLSPSDYGIAGMLGLLSALVTVIFSLGLGSIIGAYFFDDNGKKKGAVIWTSFLILSFSSLILVLLGILESKSISLLLFGSDNNSYLVWISLLTTALTIITVPFTLYMQFEEKRFTYQSLTTGMALLNVTSVVMLVVFFKRGINGMIEGGLISQFVTVFLYAMVSPKPPFRYDFQLGKQMMQSGFLLIPGFGFVFILGQNARYLLEMFHGLDAVGMLGIGIGLATPISLVSNAFQKAWMPFFMSYTNKISEAKDVLGRVLLYYVCGFGALLLVICAAAKPAVMLLTTSRFTDAYYIVGLTAAGQFLSGVFSILLPPLYFSKEVTRTSVIHGISAVVAILFGLIIIPSFGLIGAGITQMVGFLAMCILIHIWNRSQGNIYLQINYPWRRILLYPPIYFIYLLITLWPRNIGLPLEILFSLSLIIPIPALFFIMLSGYERKRGLHLGRQFLKRLGILNFSNISEPVASN